MVHTGAKRDQEPASDLVVERALALGEPRDLGIDGEVVGLDRVHADILSTTTPAVHIFRDLNSFRIIRNYFLDPSYFQYPSASSRIAPARSPALSSPARRTM